LKILLIYPKYPDTFWSFIHALKFINKKALNTPLGILTVAAMLPSDWDKKVLDMNATRLQDKDIEWADYVFISAMIVQQKSTREVIDRCKKLNKKVVAGGPLFTMAYKGLGFDDVDHIILNEAEITLPLFLEDLGKGCPKHIYHTDKKADVTKTLMPMFGLIDLKKYLTVTVQYSRGCPFDCEFCSITVLDGHKPRTKTADQVLAELEAIYSLGYRGSVFIVDDNFIGNRKKLKADVLPAIIRWMKERKYPFSFITEASIDMADDEELMQLMSDAGFNNVFVGIETPNEDSLNECNKYANKNRDLVGSVRKLQNHGFQVMGGFIVGFDNDPVSIFKSQVNFIQKSGIVTAMVGMLMAPPDTRLWHRLEKENRLLPTGTGDNTDGTTNFIPQMDINTLVNGYKHILHSIYSPKHYYERIQTFLSEFKPNESVAYGIKELGATQLKAFMKVGFELGIKDKGAWYYWKLIFSSLLKYPRFIGLSVTMAVQGLHLRKVYEKVLEIKVDNALLVRQRKLLNGEQV
jgi:radical SAM superfamily enzyme YgiQ (UPF0313 family)